MTTRKKFPSRVKIRREKALENINKRLEMGDAQVLSTAKRFLPPNKVDTNIHKLGDSLKKYRIFLKNEKKILETRIQQSN